MRIEILYFEDCPNHEGAEHIVRDVLSDLQCDAEIVKIDVPDNETAERLRFPGSPTIRIDGEDIIPDIDQTDYGLRCRLYQTVNGVSGVPDPESVRAALRRYL